MENLDMEEQRECIQGQGGRERGREGRIVVLHSSRNVDTPRFVEAMKGKHVVEVECGSSHSACILDNGALYTWGKGRYGRLGHNDYETQYKPKQVKTIKLPKLSEGGGGVRGMCIMYSSLIKTGVTTIECGCMCIVCVSV